MRIFSEVIFWLLLIGVAVILVRDQSNAVALMQGTVSSGVALSTGIANLGGPAPSSYQSA